MEARFVFEDGFDKFRTKMVRVVKDILNENMALLVTHIRKDIIASATTDSTLKSRSGHLRQTTQAISATEDSGNIKAGISFGTVSARTHVGPQGQITTIYPKRAKMLAIPLSAAMTGAGVAKGGPTDQPGSGDRHSSLWGDTFIARSKGGNLIIFGATKYQKGARTGETHGAIIPLFVLKSSVQVKARIHPKDLMEYSKPLIAKDLKEQL
jgi:hypothetical protein